MPPSEATFQVCDPDVAAGGRLSENPLSWFISYLSHALTSSQLGLTRAALGARWKSVLTERDPLSRWESEDAKKNRGQEALRNCVHLSGLQRLRAAVGS